MSRNLVSVKRENAIRDFSSIECGPVGLADFEFAQKATVAIAGGNSIVERLQLNVTSDYYSSFGRAKVATFKVASENYLWGNDKRWLDKSLLCPEMALPSHLADTVRVKVPPNSSWDRLGIALIHAGRTGCTAPVHFDWDHKLVAHACLIGRKRMFFFPPQASWLLCPIINTSALNIARYSAADRDAIVKRLEGVEVILEAGQGVLFPSTFWHGALYEEPSLSVSVRFEPRPGGRPFAVLPRSWLLQRLVWKFLRNGYGLEAEDFLTEYLKSFFNHTRTWKDRYRQIRDLCQHALLASGEQQGAFEYISEGLSPELALASEELKLYYGNAAARKPHDKDRIRETREYVFEGLNGVSAAHKLLLSKYALSLRQGLQPKRGLVHIEQE